jgi:hypothetical protein
VASVTVLHAGQPGEGVHDAPHRAKQAHVGRHGADRCEEGQVAFNGVQLALEAGAHGAAGTVEQGAGVGDAAFAQFLVLAHAVGKNAFHGAAVAGVLVGCGVQVVQAGA